MPRRLLVLVHRYVGLAIALFVAMSGLTGSLLTFHHELDEWLNPDFFAETASGAKLPPERIAAAVEASDTRLRVTYMTLPDKPGHVSEVVAAPRFDAATGQPFDLEHDWFSVDPVTGAIIGKRYWGGCCFAPSELIPFLYEFHHNLKLPEPWGLWVMGTVALAWIVDCLVAITLTFPRARPFLERWRSAWAIKRGSAYRTSFDLHRAGGLWLWLLLLMIAISGVAMTLRTEVFEPVVSLASPVTPSPFDRRGLQPPDKPVEPKISFSEVLARAQDDARRRGWTPPAGEFFYSPETGLFGVGFGQPHEFNAGNAWLYYDEAGTFFAAVVPGEGSAGDIFAQLQFPLHSGRVAGLPGRIFISLTGIGVAILSFTGVFIWWRKRNVRRAADRVSETVPREMMLPRNQ
jgi:uncharacterized iron-regulated membrane protein